MITPNKMSNEAFGPLPNTIGNGPIMMKPPKLNEVPPERAVAIKTRTSPMVIVKNPRTNSSLARLGTFRPFVPSSSIVVKDFSP